MEWSRVKSILICVFVVVNLWLVVIYIDGNKTEITVDNDTVLNTIAVLANNNISIEKSIIPNKSESVPVFNITNRYKTTKEFVNNFKSSSEYFESSSVSKNDQAIVLTNKYNNETVKEIKNLIKKSGVLDNYKYKTIDKCTDKCIDITFNAVYDNLFVFDSFISVKTEDNKLIIIFNNWLNDNYKNVGYSSVNTAPEALISFASSVHLDKTYVIESIDYGYIAGERNGEIQTATATPVWRITGEDNSVYYVDMRNGDLLSI